MGRSSAPSGGETLSGNKAHILVSLISFCLTSMFGWRVIGRVPGWAGTDAVFVNV